jgi:predicted DNA-binding ribbon-helix-helix protein
MMDSGEGVRAMEIQSRRDKRSKFLIIKRSVKIARRSTSVGLEDAFWDSLKEIASIKNISLHDLASSIDKNRQHGNLSSAIRLFVLDYYRTKPK